MQMSVEPARVDSGPGGVDDGSSPLVGVGALNRGATVLTTTARRLEAAAARVILAGSGEA